MASIDKGTGKAPLAATPNNVPAPPALRLDGTSQGYLQHAFADNALCGVVHTATGVIHLHPLKESPRLVLEEDDGELMAYTDTDAYGNTPFPTSAHTGGSGPVPIEHFGPGGPSHKQLVTHLGGQHAAYAGFTVWVGTNADHRVVCTSRSLNGPLFHGDPMVGTMRQDWADAICHVIGQVQSRGLRPHAATV